MSTDLSKKTQLTTILTQLEETGEVSRNWCLSRFISRLSGRVLDLRREGYEFSVERRNGDYVYKMIFNPHKKLVPGYTPQGW